MTEIDFFKGWRASLHLFFKIILILEQDRAGPEPVAKECCFQERHHPASVGPGGWDSSSQCHASYAWQRCPSQQHYTWWVHADGGKDTDPTELFAITPPCVCAGTPATPATPANIVQGLPDWASQINNTDTVAAVAQILQSPQGQQVDTEIIHSKHVRLQLINRKNVYLQRYQGCNGSGGNNRGR